MNDLVKKNLKLLAKIVIAVGLITWMVKRGSLDLTIFRMLTEPLLLTALMTLAFVQVLINGVRWMWLLTSQGVMVKYRYILSMSLVGLFFNFFMPGGVGGDVVKGYYVLKDYPKKKLIGATSILLDRLLGLYALILMALVILLLNTALMNERPQLRIILFGVLGLFLMMSLAFAVSLSRRFRKIISLDHLLAKIPGGNLIHKIYEAIHAYREKVKYLIGGILLSLISQSFAVLFVMITAHWMGVTDIPLAAYFFAMPLGLLCTALPVAPAGVGIGQASILFFFTAFLGREVPVGPNAMTLFQTTGFLWGLVGGIIYVQRRHFGDEQTLVTTVES